MESKMKINHLLTCKCGNHFQVPTVPFDATKPYNFKIKIEGTCNKCGEVVEQSLYHKGAGTYKTE